MDTPIDMKAAQERLQQKRYAKQVLAAWDQIEHQEARERIILKKEVERKARQRL